MSYRYRCECLKIYYYKTISSQVRKERFNDYAKAVGSSGPKKEVIKLRKKYQYYSLEDVKELCEEIGVELVSTKYKDINSYQDSKDVIKLKMNTVIKRE